MTTTPVMICALAVLISPFIPSPDAFFTADIAVPDATETEPVVPTEETVPAAEPAAACQTIFRLPAAFSPAPPVR